MAGGFSGGSQGADSIAHRTGLEDSITIHFRYLDSSRFLQFDTAVKDFSQFYPLPWHHVDLGNMGTASRSLIFSPIMKAGWDAGFHAYDAYNFTAEETRFYNTTRPYTVLGYLLGSKLQQLIHIKHTQNITPNWNASFEYRLINSPGTFRNQSTNHNNYRFTSWFQSKNKRYQNFLMILGNKLQSGENGGIKDDANYLDSISFKDRYTIPTRLGGSTLENRNFFSTSIATGSYNTNAVYMLRQQYDLGQKDSIVTDSTVIPLFYPRLRLEHTISYNTYHYRFIDNAADSVYYLTRYGIKLPTAKDTVFRRDLWHELFNDFSIYTFPDAKNPQQFLKLGASLQTLNGEFDSGLVKKSYYNFFLHGEYRNKTRNQKWDVEGTGSFYVNGLNAGDYSAYASLKRLISKQIGYLQLGFMNVNRMPSFNFDGQSDFYFKGNPTSLKKENITRLFASLDMPRQRLTLSGSYYLLGNYTYYTNYYHVEQATSLFNVLELMAQRETRLGRHFNWRTRIVLQKTAGNSPVQLPLLFTRNQVGYDGNLGFKNLLISMGVEVNYLAPYKADAYSPMVGHFFPQDAMTVHWKAPEINAYLHFRIRTFVAYLRVENLNTFSLAKQGFLNNNLVAPNYPYPGMQIRLGINWGFVN